MLHHLGNHLDGFKAQAGLLDGHADFVVRPAFWCFMLLHQSDMLETEQLC